MSQGRDTLLCPDCGQWVPHTRGFLNEHSKNIQRGALVTGSTFCDGSNTKPPAKLKTVEFNGLCTNCVSTVRNKYSETYPGSLEYYGGVITVQCPYCGPEGDYCSVCDHQLHLEKLEKHLVDGIGKQFIDEMTQATDGQPLDPHIQEMIDTVKAQGGSGEMELWVDSKNEPNCPDGQTHQNVHRQQEDRPVLLTDNHVIVVSEDA
jgi:hypothetical protein